MAEVRIGDAMLAAVRYVRDNGGAVSCALDVAEAVGPHGSRKYGYRTVNRCLTAELLAVDPRHPKAAPRSNGAIVLTAAGAAAVGGNEVAP